jgi:hypothetical protein
MQLPGDVGRDPVTQAVETGPIQRRRDRGEPGRGLQPGSFAECRRGGDRISQTLQIGFGPGQQLSRPGRVPPLGGELPQLNAGERGGSLVSGRLLGAQRGLEQRLRPGRILAVEQQCSQTLLSFRLPTGRARLPVETLGLAIQPLSRGKVIRR